MKLTNPENMLLKAISAAVRDERVGTDFSASAEEITEFFKIASYHKILPLVYEAVYRSIPANEADIFKLHTLNQVADQTQKTVDFLKLYDYMNAKGLHPLVVKGIICRSMYPHGDYRISSDEDILVPPDEWEECCRALKDYGLCPDSTDLDKQEIGWRKESLFIELHRELFDPESRAYGDLNRFFTESHDNSSVYSVDDGRTVRSLCPHDHFLFLILHAYKHFIHSGFGIRQVCDIGLWSMCYYDEIDWDKLYIQLTDAHALDFAAAVLRLSQTCLDFSFVLPEKFDVISVDPEPMLHDLLAGGVYGSSDLSRAHSATGTVNVVAADRGNKRSSVLSSVFPPREDLVSRYPELKDRPARLPIVWIKRIAKYAKETQTTENNRTADSLRIMKERKELLKLYGIISDKKK